MTLRKNSVEAGGQVLQELPIPSTREEKQPSPSDGTVDAGEGNGQEKRKTTCWERVTSLFRYFKKANPKVSPGPAKADQRQTDAVKFNANEASSKEAKKTKWWSRRPLFKSLKKNKEIPPVQEEEEIKAPQPENKPAFNDASSKEAKKTKWWSRRPLFKSLKKPKEMPPVQEEEEIKAPQPEKKPTLNDEYISSRYELGDKLGEGGFGIVYEGKRLEDGLKVAVKYVKKRPQKDRSKIRVPGYPKPLPVELALTIMANNGPKVPEIIELLDWKDFSDHYVMVFECPTPCEDLFDYVKRMGGKISESLARTIMRQVVQALLVCFERGVFHSDVKLSNILINEETHEIKLIDFGCGSVWKKLPYEYFCGTSMYCPPEYYILNKYFGKPATVWSLGFMLFKLVCGKFPTTNDIRLINCNLWKPLGLSSELCKLIYSLLQLQPNNRIGLKKILSHDWFKKNE